VADGVAVPLGVGMAVTLAVCVWLGVMDAVPVCDGVCVDVDVGVRVMVDVCVTDDVGLGVGCGVGVLVLVFVGVRLTERVRVALGVKLGDGVPVPVLELDAVTDGDAPTDCVSAGVGARLCDVLDVGRCDAVLLGVCVAVCVLEPDGVRDGVFVCVGLAVTEPVSEGDDQSHVHTPCELQNCGPSAG